MLQLSENQVGVHLCTFQAFFQKSKVNLRFPALFFIEWKTINGKSTVTMIGRKKAIENQVDLNQTLIFTSEMLYHRTQRQYLKKQSLIHLNLISNSRPDQIKLVGRIVIDLAEIANSQKYSTLAPLKLMYCSVDAEVTFSAKLTRAIESSLELHELDRSSFNDLYSFTSPNKHSLRNKLQPRDTLSERKVEEDKRSNRVKIVEREASLTNFARSPPKEKSANILIKEHVQENQQQYSPPQSLPHSLPLTETKPKLTIPAPISQNPPAVVIISKKDMEKIVEKQKDILQSQLNEHKNRIKKLQTEIKQVMRLFQESQHNSQLNKSRLYQTQSIINNLKDNETKIKQFYQQQVSILKQGHERQVSLLKSGYQADLKILRVTIQEQRLKMQDVMASQKMPEDYEQICRENHQLKLVLKDHEGFVAQLAQIKEKNKDFYTEKETIFAEITKKQNELKKLNEDSEYSKRFYESQNQQLTQNLDMLRQQIKQKSSQIDTLKQQNNNLKKQIQQKALETLSLKKTLEDKIIQLEKNIEMKDLAFNEEIKQLKTSRYEQIQAYEEKLRESRQLLAAAQQNGNKLKSQPIQQILPIQHIQPKEHIIQHVQPEKIVEVKENDENNKEAFNKLKAEHERLTMQLQKLRKSIIFPQQRGQYPQQQMQKSNLFVITERSHLQQIQIQQLKQQNATMRQKMHALIKQHEQLKASRKNQAQIVVNTQQIHLIPQQKLTQIKEQISKQYENKNQQFVKKIQQQQATINEQKDQIQSLKVSNAQINNQKNNPQIAPVQVNEPANTIIQVSKDNEGSKIRLADEQQVVKIDIINEANPVKINIQIQNPDGHEQQHFHQIHEFNFDDHNIPLTHEEVNRIQETKHNDFDEVVILRQENIKLKEQIEELKHQNTNKENEMNALKETISLKEIQIRDVSQKAIVFEQDKKKLQEQLSQKNIIQQIKPAQVIQSPVESPLLNVKQLEDEIQNSRLAISELQKHVYELRLQNEQIKNKTFTSQPIQVQSPQKETAYIIQLQTKIATLEQQMKIKDDLLAQNQKHIQENYAMKYELAELKDRYSEAQSALYERDDMINNLEESKQQLSKQIEMTIQKSQLSFHLDPKEVLMDPNYQAHAQHLEDIIQELKNQVENLKNEHTHLLSRNEELTGQINALQCQREENIKRKIGEQDVYHAQIQKLKTDLAEANINIDNYKNKIDFVQSLNNQLTQQVNIKTINIEQLKSQRQSLSQQIIKFQQQKRMLTLSCQPDQTRIPTSNLSDNIFNTPQYIKIQQQNQEIIEALRNTQTKIKDLQDMLNNFRSDYEAVIVECSKKQQKISQLSSQLDHMNNRTLNNILTVSSPSQKNEESHLDIPILEIHEVPSFHEPLPLQYEKSIIPLQESGQLSRIGIVEGLKQEKQQLKREIQKLTSELAQQSFQKFNYFNNLETANQKIIDYQFQITGLKQQIQKLTSLPISSFNITPTKPRFQQAEVYYKQRQPSILHQVRVRGELNDGSVAHSIDDNEKGMMSKDLETRVETKAITETQQQFLRRQLQILKEQLNSQAKLHRQLKEVHSNCDNRYNLLNQQNNKSIQQLEFFKRQNAQLLKVNHQISEQLQLLKGTVSRQQKIILIEDPSQVQDSPPQNYDHHSDKIIQKTIPLPQPPNNTLFSFNKQSSPQQQQVTTSKQAYPSQNVHEYQQKLALAQRNQQQLINKINILEQNLASLEKSLQEQIQINQSNDKITEKLQALADLQRLAGQFEQELEEAKLIKAELAEVKAKYEEQKSQFDKLNQQHGNCVKERGEWQIRLQSIENMLAHNENKFAQQKQQLQTRMMALNEQKASIQAQKSQLDQNLKRQSLIVPQAPVIQQNNNQIELQARIRSLQDQRLNGLQQISELSEKLNKQSEQKTKKQAELTQVIIVKDQQIEQFRFVKIQMAQQIQQIRQAFAQKQFEADSYKHERQSLVQQKNKLSQQIVRIRQSFKIQQETIKECQNMISSLKEANERNGTNNTFTQEKIATLQRQLTEKKDLSEVHLATIKELQEQSNSLKIQIEKKDAEIIEITNNIQRIQSQSFKLRQQNQQLLQMQKSLQTQLQAISKRYNELQTITKSFNESKDKQSQSLKAQIKKKDDQIKQLSKRIKFKQTEIVSFNTEVQKWKQMNLQNQMKLKQLSEKQKSLKETLLVIESESQRIVESLKLRYENQQALYKRYIQKQRQNNKLALALAETRQEIANKQKILIYEMEKGSNAQLQASNLRKNLGMLEINEKLVTVEYSKYESLMEKNEQLMAKNREYLEIISHKSGLSVENEKLKRELSLAEQERYEVNEKNKQISIQFERKIAELEKQLLILVKEKDILTQKLAISEKQLLQVKVSKALSQNQSILKILKQKEIQIDGLKQTIASRQQNTNQQTLQVADKSDEINRLNGEIIEKNKEIAKLKSISTTSNPSQEMQKLLNQLQDRCLREEQFKLQIAKLEGSKRKDNDAKGSANVEHLQVISYDLRRLCQQIKGLCQKRSNSEEGEQIFQAVLQKYQQMEEQFGSLNQQTALIQQKAKFIGKQLHKAKAFIIKTQNRPFKEKTQLLALLKPCQNAIKQLISISETLSEKDSQTFS